MVIGRQTTGLTTEAGEAAGDATLHREIATPSKLETGEA